MFNSLQIVPSCFVIINVGYPNGLEKVLECMNCIRNIVVYNYLRYDLMNGTSFEKVTQYIL